MKRDARCLVVAGALACGSPGMPPPGGAGPNTGAVTTIVPSETDARVPRVEDLLRAVPGLEVTKLANGAYRLRIRGQRSLRGDAGDENPLLVIDGIAIPNESMGAMLADLPPSDIARIEVLKDAGSTSMYGSRGANGVIVITTKRGR